MVPVMTPGEIPRALMRAADDVPMVRIGPGVSVQYLQVDLEHNIRVTRALLEPGLRLRRHTHTGHVFAWTLGGSWKYIEYPDVNVAGCYLYEPSGSSHTLVVPAESSEPADVIFIVHGGNVDHGDDGSIVSVTDAHSLLAVYLRACREQGLPRPNVIGLPAHVQSDLDLPGAASKSFDTASVT
jgi:2,4'-dihydroxyacetophenone dioxygenase